MSDKIEELTAEQLYQKATEARRQEVATAAREIQEILEKYKVAIAPKITMMASGQIIPAYDIVSAR